MMEESLEAILALLRSDEPVTRETDWFTIREARLQMRPYTHPHPEVAVAAMVSPSGPRLAGKHGVSLLSLSMSVAEGFAAVGQAWGVVEEQAAKARHARARPVDVARARHHAPRRDPRPGHRGLHPRPAGLRRLLRRRRRVRAPGQPGRRRAPDAARRTSRPTPTRATSSSAPPTTPSPTSRACSSSRAGSAPSSCSATTGPTRRPRSSRTACSPARSSRTSRASWPPRARRTSGRRPSGASCSARAGQAILNAITSHVEEKAADAAPAAPVGADGAEA